MNNINIEASHDSPQVILDYENGLIEINGKSYPGNAMAFYESTIEWFKIYFSGKAKEKTVINISLKYFNSATSQILYDMFDIVHEGSYNELEFNWFYSEEDPASYEDYEDMAEEFPDLHIKAVKI